MTVGGLLIFPKEIIDTDDVNILSSDFFQQNKVHHSSEPLVAFHDPHLTVEETKDQRG